MGLGDVERLWVFGLRGEIAGEVLLVRGEDIYLLEAFELIIWKRALGENTFLA